MNLPNELFSLETLAAFPGLVIATWTVVQFTKGGVDWLVKLLFKGAHWSTQGWAYVVAAILLILVSYFSGELTLPTLFLDVINAFFVAMAAMKVHESAAQPTGIKPQSTYEDM